eukprot:14820037-Alexandrium_andersonii.AAC.1
MVALHLAETLVVNADAAKLKDVAPGVQAECPGDVVARRAHGDRGRQVARGAAGLHLSLIHI